MTPDLLATVLRTAFDGVWIVDGAGHFVEVNAAYCALIGYSRDELLGMSIADVEATESPDEVAAHAQKVRTQGGDRFVTRHRRKDGTILDVEVCAALSRRGWRPLLRLRPRHHRAPAAGPGLAGVARRSSP